MKRIFVDTNILVDLIAVRHPFSKFAIDLFKKADNKDIHLYTSSHSIATTHYLLKKYITEKELREILFHLIELITVIPIDNSILKKGLKSVHKDFEDAIQIYSASSIEKIDCIVTRNVKDFRKSEILVLNPDEVLSRI